MNEAKRASIVRKYEDGASLRAIAEAHGVTVPSVRAAVRKAGVKTRPNGRPRGSKSARGSKVDADEVRRLRSAGMTWREVAEQLGVSVSTAFEAAR